MKHEYSVRPKISLKRLHAYKTLLNKPETPKISSGTFDPWGARGRGAQAWSLTLQAVAAFSRRVAPRRGIIPRVNAALFDKILKDQEDPDCPRKYLVTERAIALTVTEYTTVRVSRYRKQLNFGC